MLWKRDGALIGLIRREGSVISMPLFDCISAQMFSGGFQVTPEITIELLEMDYIHLFIIHCLCSTGGLCCPILHNRDEKICDGKT